MPVIPGTTMGGGSAAGAAGSTPALGYFGAVMSIFGMGQSVIGSYYGAKSQKLQFESQALTAQFQSELSGINARMVEAQAVQIWKAGEHQALQVGLRAGQVMGAARASLAARGVDIGVGSAAEAVATTDLMKDIDMMTINSNTVRQVEAERMRKVGIESTSRMQSLSAQNLSSSARGISPFMAGATSLISGAANFAGAWYKGRRTAYTEE